MTINEVNYDDKLIQKWQRLSDNLQYAMENDWLPVPLDDEVVLPLLEAGYPNYEGKSILYVKCPKCDREYMFNQRTWINRHKAMCKVSEK